jgi:Subtilase family/Secretion system C-terminal sorting domain
MMSQRYLIIFSFIVISILACDRCEAQDKFSTKFHNAVNGRHTAIRQFSVSVRSNDLFITRYRDKIQIIKHDTDARVFVFAASLDFIKKAFSTDDNILFVDAVTLPTVEAPNDYLNISLNRINKAKRFYPELRGAGLTVSVKENSFDDRNLDILGRTFSTTFTSQVTAQHATAMATFIAGAGNTSEKGLGVATDAQLTSSDFTNLLPDNASYFFTYNIRQQNHSYGVSLENYYGNEAVAYDQHVHSNPDLLHIFSAGNIGKTKPLNGIYKDLEWANLSGNFKQAKNVLVVTAVDTSFVRNASNSRGPAYDGRLKPELTAHGHNGTSDAAALASGMAVIIREKLLSQGFGYGSSAMVKAILIATSDDIGAPGIDFTFGYGNANLYDALQLVALENIHAEILDVNAVKNIPITIPAGVSEVRIATTWIDPPTTVNQSQALVNDVDTYLEYDGSLIHPWVLNHYPHPDSLTLLAERKPDHLNNVEFITIANPLPGTYNLLLKAQALTSSQAVAVAYCFKEGTFNWDYPVHDDVLEAKTRVKLLWSNAVTSPASIEVKINDGDWMTVGSIDGLGQTHYAWNVPDTFAIATLRMNVGGVYYPSSTFVISPRVNLNVPFNCQSSFALSWAPVDGASHYQLKTFNGTNLEVVEENADTIAVLENEIHQYFTVLPMIGSAVGLPAATIDYATQGAGCYLNYFSAYRFNDGLNKLDLQLSTLWNVKQVQIYRVIDGVYLPLKRIDPVSQNAFELFDEDLIPGTMSYVAEVALVDGVKIQSGRVDVLVEEKGSASLYPNPAVGSSVNVLSEGQGRTLQVFDRQGKLVLTYSLDLYLETLDVSSLVPGLYFFQLSYGGNVIDRGRFVKL